MPRILENVHSSTAIETNYQRKLFRHGQYIYLFYVQEIGGEAGLFYRFAGSPEGLAAAPELPATTPQPNGWKEGRQYVLHYDAPRARVGLAWVNHLAGGEDEPCFRYGDLQDDGSILWSAEHRTTANAYSECRTPAVTCDEQGYWGVLCAARNDVAHHLLFTYSANAAPSARAHWTSREGMDLFGAVETSDHYRLGSGGSPAGFTAFYKDGDQLTARLWNGASFSEPYRLENIAVRDTEISAAVNDAGGTLHLAFFSRDNNSLQHAVFFPADGRWETRLISDQLPSSASSPSLQIDSEGNLYLFCRLTAGQQILYFNNRDGQWQNKSRELSGDLAAAYQQLNNTPTTAAWDARAVLVAWLNITPGDPSKPGRNELWTDQIELPLRPPRAAFRADKTSCQAPCQIAFTDQSVAGSGALAEWNWEFGDDRSAAEQHPRHQYDNPGEYTVKLTVTDVNQISDAEEKVAYIRIEAPAPQEFECHPNRIYTMLCYLAGWLSGVVMFFFKRKEPCIVFHALQSLFTFLPLNAIHYLIIKNQETGASLFGSTASLVLLVVTALIWLVMITTTLSDIMLKLPLTGGLAAKIAFPDGRLPKNMRKLF